MGPIAIFINHYETLRVGRKAASSDIKRAYYEHCLQVHPDKHPPYQSDYWNEIQMRINVARDLLMNPQKRASYDRIWARELKVYFASGWERKPPRAYNPPKPPHVRISIQRDIGQASNLGSQVITAEKNLAKIDHILTKLRIHVAELEAGTRKIAANNIKLQEIIDKSIARSVANDHILVNYLRAKLETDPDYRNKVEQTLGPESASRLDHMVGTAHFGVT